MIRLARPQVYDLLGILWVGAFVAWTVVSAAVKGADPAPQLAVLTVATAAYVAGRARGRERPVFVAGAIVISILVVTVLSGPSAVSGGASEPLGYANANGALFTLGVAAAAIIAVVANEEQVRRPAGVLAVVLLALAAATMSAAATILSAAVLLVAFAVHRVGRWVVLTGPLLAVSAVATTIVLAFTHDPRPLQALERGLSERRTILWHEALEMISDNPVLGLGPGMFSETSPTALREEDAAWAHSAYLQIGAETGVVGLVLFLVLLLWAFGALYRSHQDIRLIIIAAAGMTAVAVHAAIDYLAHFPGVVAVAALLIGLGSSRQTQPTTTPSPG